MRKTILPSDPYTLVALAKAYLLALNKLTAHGRPRLIARHHIALTTFSEVSLRVLDLCVISTLSVVSISQKSSLEQF